MTREEALDLLGVSPQATVEQIEKQYGELFSDYQIRLTNAPTPALRKLYQKNLGELEAAHRLLSADVAEAGVRDRDLPTTEPIYTTDPSMRVRAAPRESPKLDQQRPRARTRVDTKVGSGGELKTATDRPGPDRPSDTHRPGGVQEGEHVKAPRRWIVGAGVLGGTIAVILLARVVGGNGRGQTDALSDRSAAASGSDSVAPGGGRVPAAETTKLGARTSGAPASAAGSLDITGDTAQRTKATPSATLATPSRAEGPGIIQIIGALPESARLTLNGEKVSGRTIRVTPGREHSLTVSAPGYSSATWSGRAGPNETIRWNPRLDRTRDSSVAATVAPVPVASLTIVHPDTITVGESRPLAAHVLDSRGRILGGRDISWASENPTVATVDITSGMLTARAAGSVTISATAEGRTARMTLDILAKPDPKVSTPISAAPSPRQADVRPPVSAAPTDEIAAGVLLKTLINGYLTLIQSRDARRVAGLFSSPTNAEKDLLTVIRSPESRLRIVEQRIGTPTITGDRASADFSVKMSWKTAFGASRTEWIQFRADFENAGGNWRMTSCRIPAKQS